VNKKIIFSLSLIIVLSLLTTQAYAFPKCALYLNLNGTAYNDTGVLDAATVTVTTNTPYCFLENGASATTTTDSIGYYQLNPRLDVMSPDRTCQLNITIERNGHETREEVNIITADVTQCNQNWPFDGTYHQFSPVLRSFSLAPQFSNNYTLPDPATYSPGQNYYFYIDWTDNFGVSNVILDAFGNQYNSLDLGLGVSGNTYSKMFTDLSAGTYTYVWSANDTNNNINDTGTLIFEILKADNPVSLLLNGQWNTIFLTYPDTVTATAVSTAGTVKIWRDEQDVTDEKNSPINLPASVSGYVYKANATDDGPNGNYSTNNTGVSYVVYVNRAQSAVGLTFDKTSSITYGEGLTATCTDTNPEEAANLYRNVSGPLEPVNGENGLLVTLDTGDWYYVCNVSQSQNYTEASTSATFTILPIQPTIELFLNDFVWSSDVIETYPFTTEVNGTISEISLQGDVILEVNGTSVPNPEPLQLLDADTYNYTAYYPGSNNYQPYSITRILTILKADPLDPSDTLMGLTLNGQPNDVVISYGDGSVASGWKTFTEGTIELYRNGTLIDSDSGSVLEDMSTDDLPADVWNYTLAFPGSTNYQSASITRILTIDPQTVNVDLFLNGSQNNLEVDYGTVINATATIDQPVSLIFEREGSPISNPDIGILPAGQYVYYAHFDGNRNYTADSETYTLTVNPADPGLTFTIDPPVETTYNTLVNATCSDNNPERDAVLWRNGEDVTADENGKLVLLPGDTYNYVCNITASDNYTFSEITQDYIVNAMDTEIILYFEGSEWLANQTRLHPYDPQGFINATINVSEIQNQIKLYINGTESSNPDNEIKSYGEYEYYAEFLGNNNYSASSTPVRKLTVQDLNPPSYSGCSITPAPATYSPGQEYNFTCDWTDDVQIDKVMLTFDTQDYEATNIGGNTYQVQFTDLAGASYNYNWFANDTFGNSISEPSGIYTVSPRIQNIGLTLDGQNNDIIVEYETETTALATTDVGTVALWRNISGVMTDVTSTENGILTKLDADVHEYEARGLNNENYTSTPVSHILTVQPKVTSIDVYLNDSMITTDQTFTYPYPIKLEAVIDIPELQGGVTTELNTNPVSNPEEFLLDNNTYTYTASYAGNSNYTPSSETRTIRINKAQSNVNLIFTPSSPQKYRTDVNATCGSDNPEANAILWRNKSGTMQNVNDENGVPVRLSAGTHNYICNVSTTTNYIGDETTDTYVIHVVDPFDPSDPHVFLTINGESNDLSVNYNENTTALGWKNFEEGTLTLYRNGTDVTPTENNTEITLPVGVWNYTLELTDVTNYTSGSITRIVTVQDNEIPSLSCSVSPESPTHYAEGKSYTFSCDITDNYQLDTVIFNFNTQDYATTQTGDTFNVTLTDLSANSSGYTYSWFANDTSGNSETKIANYIIDKAPTEIILYYDNSIWTQDKMESEPYTPDINATINISSLQSDVELYVNGTLVSNPDAQQKNKGFYDYYATFAGNENYSSVTTPLIRLTVADLTPPLLTITNPNNNDVTGTTVWLNATTDENTICYFGTQPGPVDQMTDTVGTQHSELLTNLPYGEITYYVNCTDGFNTAEDSVTWNVSREYTIDLVAGWNLISLPFVPYNPIMTDNSVWGSGEYIIQHYNSTTQSWVEYNSTEGTTVFEIVPDWGYWIYVNSARTLSFLGQEPGQRSVNLLQGVNMVGWTNSDPTDMEIALYFINDTVDNVQCQNTSDLTQKLLRQCYPPSGENFEPGKGYFINVTNNTIWTYLLNIPPIADAGPDRTLEVGDDIIFNASASYDLDGYIVSYSWNLGNGDSMPGETISYPYTIPGTYTVTLTVVDDDGAVGTDTAQITVVTPQGGGGGGGLATRRPELTISSPDELTITQGESETISITIENTGQVVVENIKVSVNGVTATFSQDVIDELDVDESISIDATITVDNSESEGEKTINFIARGEGYFEGDKLRVTDSSATTLMVLAKEVTGEITPEETEGSTGPAGYMTAVSDNAPIVGGVILIVAVAGGLYYLFRKKKLKLPSFLKTRK